MARVILEPLAVVVSLVFGRVNICVVRRVGRKFTSNYFLLVENYVDGKIINYVGITHTTTVIAEPTIR